MSHCEQAVMDLAISRRHRDRLITADQAGAGIEDGLEQVAFRTNLSNFRQVRANVPAPIADGMTREARGFLTVKNELAATNVTATDCLCKLVNPAPAAWRNQY